MNKSSIAAKARIANKPEGYMRELALKKHSKTTKEERSQMARELNRIRWEKVARGATLKTSADKGA